MSDTAAGPPSTGGVDLGPLGQIHGRIPGLNAITTAGATAAPAVLEAYLRGRKAAKGFNDAPEDKTVGTQDGQVVKDAAEV